MWVMIMSALFASASGMLLAADSSATDFSPFLQYGVLGIFAAIMATLIRTLLKREQDRADRLEEENKRLYGLMSDKMIPALERSQFAMTDVLTELKEQRKERDIERMARDLDNRRRIPPKGEEDGKS